MQKLFQNVKPKIFQLGVLQGKMTGENRNDFLGG